MNKKMFKFAVLFMSLLATVSFSSCSSDDDPTENVSSVNRVTLSRETEYGNDWIYFSLSQGKELTGINEANHKTNSSWDLAFNRYNVRTNGGLSGNGQGGAFDTEETNFDKVQSVPANATFVLDQEGKITDNGKWTEAGPPTTASTYNKKLGEAIRFAGPPPTYTPNDHVYIVRTADGKYAKIQIEGFFNDEGESGYITFKYAYQPDGSTNF